MAFRTNCAKKLLYMVIEHYTEVKAVYERYNRKGRMLPDGLVYVNSWVETNGERCFQLMQTDDYGLFSKWTANWNDIVNFEIVPVVTSAEAATQAMAK